MYDETNSQAAYWGGLVAAWGPRLLVAILILLVTHFLAKAIKWGLAKAVDKVPALQRKSAAQPGETLGTQLGSLAYWVVWLVGLIVALQPLGLAQALTPIHALTNEIFLYFPRIVGAGLIFFIGILFARIVRNIVETALAATNADGWLSKLGVGELTGAEQSSLPAIAPAAASKMSISRTIGMVVFALIAIPVSIAALEALGISSIVDPAVTVLQTVLNAIPSIFAAAIVLAIAWFIGRWVKGIVEQILSSLGFDRALTGWGGFVPTAQPSRVVGAIVLTAIMLFGAIEATRLLDFDAVAQILVQVTELGGRVVFGSAIIVVGVLMARIVTNLVGQSVGESGLPSILKYAIIALAVAIGLRFMGLANEIVNLAFGLILGAAAVACALAFGLGGRATAHKLLEKWLEGKCGISSKPVAAEPAAPAAPTPPAPPIPPLDRE